MTTDENQNVPHSLDFNLRAHQHLLEDSLKSTLLSPTPEVLTHAQNQLSLGVPEDATLRITVQVSREHCWASDGGEAGFQAELLNKESTPWECARLQTNSGKEGKSDPERSEGLMFVEELGARPLRTRWKSTLARTSGAKDSTLPDRGVISFRSG